MQRLWCWPRGGWQGRVRQQGRAHPPQAQGLKRLWRPVVAALRCARASLGHRHRGREDSDARESVDRLRAARADRLRAGLKAQANVARHSEAGPSVGEPSRPAGADATEDNLKHQRVVWRKDIRAGS